MRICYRAAMRPLLVVLVLAVLPLFAQEKLVESIEVRVVNLDVVVTDRDGKPVPGLTAKDFEILEDKRPQTITNFYEVRGGAPAATTEPAAPMRPRSFLLFIENRAMHPVLRRHVTAELKKFIDTQLRPGDKASVISWNLALSIEAPLTTDKAALHAALDKVAESGTPASTKSDFARVQQRCTRNLEMARSGRMLMRMAYEDCIGDARIEAQRLTTFSRMVLNALDVTMATVAGVEGKKVLVMAGTELPVKPGLDMFQWANGLFSPYMRGFDAAIQRPADEEKTQRELLETLGRSANAHGVTLYLLSVLMPTDTMSATSATGITDNGGELLRSTNTEAAHETLAKLTGGTAEPVSRLNQMLATIDRDLGAYYSLGYRPASGGKGDRPITVRAKNRAYTVRARQTYAPKTFDDQMTDRVVANIFTPAPDDQWKAELRAGTPQLVEKGRYSVPIEIIAPATVTLLPQGNELAGGFTVFVAVGNPQGMLSTTFKQPNSIRIKAAEEAGFRNEPLVFTATLTLKEGENLLSVGVLDQVSNAVGFARGTVVAK